MFEWALISWWSGFISCMLLVWMIKVYSHQKIDLIMYIIIAAWPITLPLAIIFRNYVEKSLRKDKQNDPRYN